MAEIRKRLVALGRAIFTVAVLLAVGSLLYYVVYHFQLVPEAPLALVQIAATAILGYLVIEVVARAIRSLTSKAFGARSGSEVSVAFRFAGYMILALIVLSFAGVTGTALLAGGTFAGLVLGLAGTTVLSNIMGGVLLLTSHPYEVGDRVTITTWQYGMVVPSYPGKFFSDDRLIVGYTGVVQDLSLTYTSVKLDEGPLMKIPNNVMVQAAILRHSTPRWVRVRYEVSGHPEPQSLLEAVEAAVRRNPWIVDPYNVSAYLQAITPMSTVVAVDALCKSAIEDPPRSSILVDVDRAARSFASPET